MSRPLSKALFLDDLRVRSVAHAQQVAAAFMPLSQAQLVWRPSPKEWSILHCLDHLNQTHLYYQSKLARVLTHPVAAPERDDDYAPSWWGRIYMAFAFNPRLSFPTPDVVAPQATPPVDAAAVYLARQVELRARLDAVAQVDLRRTRVPIEKGVSFNVGDCLRILVYHDALHLGQAAAVAAAYVGAHS